MHPSEPPAHTDQPSTSAPANAAGEVVFPDAFSDLVEHDELAELQRQLEEALARADEYRNQMLAAHADMDNLRKRTERELGNAHRYALEKLFVELLPVRDSLEMGLQAAADTTDPARLREGSEMILRMLDAALFKFGLQEVLPQGQRFDPQHHEALAMAPAPEGIEANTVLQVVQKGYRLHDRLIRPAKVIVSRSA